MAAKNDTELTAELAAIQADPFAKHNLLSGVVAILQDFVDSKTNGGGQSVANKAALLAYPANVRSESTLLYVQTYRDWFWWRPASAQTAIDGEVIDDTGGQWVRLGIPDRQWATQASWYIDPIGGDNEATGLSSGTALKSAAELRRRVNGQTLHQTTQINVLSDIAEWINLSVALAPNPGSASCRLILTSPQSSWTTLYTGNAAGITSVTAINRATNTPLSITDSNMTDWLTAGTSLSSLVGHRIRLTSGANVGATAWIVKRVSATQARCTPFTPDPNLVTIGAVAANVSPAPGDQYVVERIPGVYGIRLSATRDDATFADNTLNAYALVVDSLEPGKGLANIQNGTVALEVNGSNFDPAALISRVRFSCFTGYGTKVQWWNCLAAGSFQSGFGNHTAGGSLTGLTFGADALSTTTVTGDFLCQANGANGLTFQRAMFVGNVGVFDGAVGMVLTEASRIAPQFSTITAGSTLYGSGNSQFGVQVSVDCTLVNLGTGTVTGTTGDTQIGGRTIAWSATPFVVPAKMCGIIVSTGTELFAGVQSLASSTNLATYSATDGQIVWVQSRKMYVRFALGQALATGPGVFAGLGGQWNRLPIPDAAWAFQATWFQDGTNGDDDASGIDTTHPIKTFAELAFRINNQPRGLQQHTTLTVKTTTRENLTLRQLVLASSDGVTVVPYRFAVQSLSSAWTPVYPLVGTTPITTFAYTNRQASATHTRTTLTDSSITVDPATLVGHRIRIVGGARDGATAWVVAKLSATSFSTTGFAPKLADVLSSTASVTMVTPQAGDAYVVEDVVGIGGYDIRGSRSENAGSGTQSFQLVFADLDIGSYANTTSLQSSVVANASLFESDDDYTSAGGPQFWACRFCATSVRGTRSSFYNCFWRCYTSISLAGNVLVAGGFLALGSSVLTPASRQLTFFDDTILEGVGLDVTAQRKITLSQGQSGWGALAVYNVSTGNGPIIIRSGGFMDCSSLLFGTNPSSPAGAKAVRIQTNAWLKVNATVTTNMPVISGSTPGTDVQLGNSLSVGWSTATPLFNVKGNCGVIWDNPAASERVTCEGKINTTSLGTNVATTGLIAADAVTTFPPAGVYRICIYFAITQNGATGDKVTFTIGWTDTRGANTATPINAVLVDSTAPRFYAAELIVATAGTANVTYAVSFSPKTGSPLINLRIAIELVGGP